MMKTWLCIILLVGSLLGCESNFYDLAFEPNKDPEISLPQVKSFESYEGIQIKWEKDPLANGYVLYRQILPSGSIEEIFRGEATTFFDKPSDADKVYHYFLAKTRGQREFLKSNGVPGAYNKNAILEQGNGLLPDTAIQFTGIADGKVFFYGSGSAGNISVESKKWFYYDLPAQMKLYFSIEYPQLSNPNIALACFNDTPALPGNQSNIFIQNSSLVTKRIAFSVRYNISTDPQAIIVVPFTLKMTSIVPMN